MCTSIPGDIYTLKDFEYCQSIGINFYVFFLLHVQNDSGSIPSLPSIGQVIGGAKHIRKRKNVDYGRVAEAFVFVLGGQVIWAAIAAKKTTDKK